MELAGQGIDAGEHGQGFCLWIRGGSFPNGKEMESMQGGMPNSEAHSEGKATMRRAIFTAEAAYASLWKSPL